MSKSFFLPFSIFVCFTFPFFAHAGISITEIMYDLEGADTDREWIEIQNTGSAGIDATTLKFIEADTNHALTTVAGGAELSPGAFAIIAENTSQFKADWPAFGGILLDSSWSSLSNTGETLSIGDGAGSILDSVTYTSIQGAAGDGGSLQRSDSSWFVALPTPGAASNESAVLSPPPPSPSPSPSPSPFGSPPAPQQSTKASILVVIEKAPDRAPAGTESNFKATGYGLEGKPLHNIRYLWTLGDGTLAEGQEILHTFLHPGTYIVVVDIVSGEYSASARKSVSIVPFDVSISDSAFGSDGYIELSNKSAAEVLLGNFQLQAGSVSFVIPSNTFLGANASVRFSASATALSAPAATVRLLYPNGSVAFLWEGSVDAKPAKVVTVPSSSVAKTPKVASAPPTVSSRPKKIVESSEGQKPRTAASFAEASVASAAASVAGAVEEERVATTSLRVVSAPDSSGILWYVILGAVLLAAAVALVALPARNPADEVEIVE